MAPSYRWYEVWTDDYPFTGNGPPYVLLLLANSDESRFFVYDPREKRTVEEFASHAGARNWLFEDEFSKVDGRMTVDD